MRKDEMRWDKMRLDKNGWDKIKWDEMRWDKIRIDETRWGEIRWNEILMFAQVFISLVLFCWCDEKPNVVIDSCTWHHVQAGGACVSGSSEFVRRQVTHRPSWIRMRHFSCSGSFYSCLFFHPTEQNVSWQGKRGWGSGGGGRSGLSAPPTSTLLCCHRDGDVPEKTGPGVYCVLWQLWLGDAVATAPALWTRLLPGMPQKIGHGHKWSGDLWHHQHAPRHVANDVSSGETEDWPSSHLLLSRCGSHVLSVDKTRLGPEEEPQVLTSTWPPSWEWRLSRPAPPPAPRPHGAPNTGRGPQLGLWPWMESCGWGKRSPMTAGPTEDLLNHVSIATPAAAHWLPVGCAAGSAAQGGAEHWAYWS